MSTYAVVDPATGTEVRSYPTATDADIEAALAAAAQAHATWSRETSVAERARWSAGSVSCTPSAARNSPRSSTGRWARASTTPSRRWTSPPRSTRSTPTTPRSCSLTSLSRT